MARYHPPYPVRPLEKGWPTPATLDLLRVEGRRRARWRRRIGGLPQVGRIEQEHPSVFARSDRQVGKGGIAGREKHDPAGPEIRVLLIQYIRIWKRGRRENAAQSKAARELSHALLDMSRAGPCRAGGATGDRPKVAVGISGHEIKGSPVTGDAES
jgi:hypothetical protein